MTVLPKWISNIFLLQLEDLIAQITPLEQTGFIKGRSIWRNVYSARGWEHSDECLMLSLDFSNAYPTMSHNLTQAILETCAVPPLMIRAIIAMLKFPPTYGVGRGDTQAPSGYPAGRPTVPSPVCNDGGTTRAYDVQRESAGISDALC